MIVIFRASLKVLAALQLQSLANLCNCEFEVMTMEITFRYTFRLHSSKVNLTLRGRAQMRGYVSCNVGVFDDAGQYHMTSRHRKNGNIKYIGQNIP